MVSYDGSLFDFDYERRERGQARIKSGAVLYRIASLDHWDRQFILSGGGAEQGSPAGRFHRIDQRTTYCSNNVILCLAEMLYHMYRRVLDGIIDGHAFEHLLNWRERECRLVVFSVEEITEIIYIDSQATRTDYDPRMHSWAVVCPDPTYKPFHHLGDKLRESRKRGVVYPSARHSRDVAFAFFRDETDKVKGDIYEAVDVRLQLIAEMQNLAEAPTFCSPLDAKLHATMGFYEFTTVGEFESLKERELLNPMGLPSRGYVDFVRRRYLTYPDDALLSCR